ncbi:hypothetical protein Tco_0728096 [Tanacetum coccineum]|uniref:Reverse transcriptase domain-containing protein n=1 Tax=Tanacetum coccineum TaxID=301880 RepID=A0ABQ4YL31_9ASTR
MVKTNLKIEVDCYDHDISSDDDSYENIEYVEASPLNLEYDSLEKENEDQEEKEFDLEDIFQIQDVILHNSLPEFETFSDHTEETISGSTTTHANNSLPEYDSFLFEIEPDQGGLISIFISDNSNDPLLELPKLESFHFDLYDDLLFPRPPPEPPDIENGLIVETNAPVINNVGEINVEDDDSFTFVIRTFLPFLTYPEVRILQKPQENGQNQTNTDTGMEKSVQEPEECFQRIKDSMTIRILMVDFCTKIATKSAYPGDHKDVLALGDYKVGRSARIVSSDEASLGDQEDASK